MAVTIGASASAFVHHLPTKARCRAGECYFPGSIGNWHKDRPADYSRLSYFDGSSLDRTCPPQGDVEIAHGGHQHRQDGEAVDARADQESRHHVTVEQAGDAVKRPERRQQRDQARWRGRGSWPPRDRRAPRCRPR